jgi:hypothetical protein
MSQTAERWWVRLAARWLARIDSVSEHIRLFSLAVTAFSTFSLVLQNVGLGQFVPLVGAGGALAALAAAYLYAEGGVWNQVSRDRQDLSNNFSGPAMLMDRTVDAQQRAYLAWLLDPEDRPLDYHRQRVEELTEDQWAAFRDGIGEDRLTDTHTNGTSKIMTDKPNTTDDDSTDSQPDRSELETAKAIVDEAIGRGISRRALMLAAAAGASGAALGTLGGRASAASPSNASGTVYFEQIGDSNHPVQELYINQQFVSASQQSLEVDDVSDNGSGAVTFSSPLSASTAEVSSTFTDPAGTSHSGELADAADVVSDHSNLSNVTSDQHHAQVHGNSDHSPDMVEDATTTGNAPYEVQKNGTDGTGIINFKT